MECDAFLIQPTAVEPIYRQIEQQLRRLIAARQLAVGEALPSVREVAGFYGINPMTVSRAYAELESQGLLERRRGKSMVVSARAATPAPLEERAAQLDPLLEQLRREARELDVPLERIQARLTTIWGKKS